MTQLVMDLEQTKETILTYGWTRGTFQDYPQGPVCVVGAARIVTTGSAFGSNARTMRVRRAMERQVPWTHFGGSLMGYNDLVGQRAILRLIDRAIRAERGPFQWPIMGDGWSSTMMRIEAAGVSGPAVEVSVEPIDTLPEITAPDRELALVR